MLELLDSIRPSAQFLSVLGCVFGAGLANGMMDSIDHHLWKFSEFDVVPEGRFKEWLLGKKQIGKGKRWMIGPLYIIQDGWHCFKQLMVFAFLSIPVIMLFAFNGEDDGWFAIFATYGILACTWGIGFETSYRLIWRKK
jgi:hypothetical protein